MGYNISLEGLKLTYDGVIIENINDKKEILRNLPINIDSNNYIFDDVNKLIAKFPNTARSQSNKYLKDDQNYFKGTLWKTPRDGLCEARIDINSLKIDDSGIFGILSGTSPHFNRLFSLEDPGTYYLERTKEKLIIYNSDGTTVKETLEADNFIDSIIPLKIMVICQGPGGRGAYGIATGKGTPGGGSGGLILCIIDLYKCPKWKLTVGKGATNTSTSVSEGTNTQIESVSVSENTITATIGGNGYQGISSETAGSGGSTSFSGSLVKELFSFNGKSGGTQGNAGQNTSTQSLQLTYSLITYESNYEFILPGRSGGSAGGDKEGGGGGASYFADGGKGGGGDSNKGSSGSLGSGGGGANSQSSGTAPGGNGGDGFIYVYY